MNDKVVSHVPESSRRDEKDGTDGHLHTRMDKAPTGSHNRRIEDTYYLITIRCKGGRAGCSEFDGEKAHASVPDHVELEELNT